MGIMNRSDGVIYMRSSVVAVTIVVGGMIPAYAANFATSNTSPTALSLTDAPNMDPGTWGALTAGADGRRLSARGIRYAVERILKMIPRYTKPRGGGGDREEEDEQNVDGEPAGGKANTKQPCKHGAELEASTDYGSGTKQSVVMEVAERLAGTAGAHYGHPNSYYNEQIAPEVRLFLEIMKAVGRDGKLRSDNNV